MDEKSLPPDVSKVYFQLSDFVDKKYSTASAPARRVIFALAYFTYCSRKKRHICHMKTRSERQFSKIEYRKVHDHFNDHDNFDEFTNIADSVLREYSSQAQTELIQEDIHLTIRSCLPTFRQNVFSNILTSIAVGFLLLIWVLLKDPMLSLARNDSIEPYMYSTAVWVMERTKPKPPSDSPSQTHP